MNATMEPFFGKTWRLIRDIWPRGEQNELKDRLQPDLPNSDLSILRHKINDCLEGLGGEVSARSRAAELGRAYLVLNTIGRRRFLELLADEYGVDNNAIENAIVRRSDLSEPVQLQDANGQLRALLDSPRTKLLGQFNELAEGVKFLVDLRAELISFAKHNPSLRRLDRDVLRLLTSWFDIGFLNLRKITWDTSAAILEKLIEYEAVHTISSWKALKNRLREDRRCYGFFHPKMRGEPLIFVEVALVNGISQNIQVLLDVDCPVQDLEKTDTAIFYSISSCQKGLAGVSFGNFLIKRVVSDLAEKHPNLKTFSTLSPIPGFMAWLLESYESLDMGQEVRDPLRDIFETDKPLSALTTLLLDQARLDTEDIDTRLPDALLHLCSRYLLESKRGIQALDRVAHFHLSNGAHLERINWGGNLTAAGIEQSAGIMVNYRYKLSRIEENHERYTGDGEIAVSASIKKLLKG